MSGRLRIRLLLIAAFTLVAAGVGSGLLQRQSSMTDLREYRAQTGLRSSLLEASIVLHHVMEHPGGATLTAYDVQQDRLGRSIVALAPDRGDANEGTEQRRLVALAREWNASANAVTDAVLAGRTTGLEDGHAARDAILTRFLASADRLEAAHSAERASNETAAIARPIAIVVFLCLIFALVLWLSVERPARGEGRRRAMQAEFGEAMQVARSEAEAYAVLAKHVARAAGSGHVAVLNRNNSADRLEPATPVAEGPLAQALTGATPDSCLSVRLARTHARKPGDAALLSCELCGRCETETTCVPSLVGGQVVGSVLVEHRGALPADGIAQIEASVAEAAPVVANLRDLAIAELRAATDGLTGLPNHRATHDTLTRMAAQAGRLVSPLTVALFDLDRFKEINDTFGHGKGDEVLAAIGDVTSSTVRTSDFVGRLGGEEFAVLLPDTGAEGALALAEKLRAAFAAISVMGVDRTITASFGIAVLPDHAPDAPTLLRNADRALYAAKGAGRDRAEVFRPGAPAHPAPTS